MEAGETHSELLIISDHFKGMNLYRRNELIYKIVDKEGKMTLRVEIPILQINRQKDMPEEALREEVKQAESEEAWVQDRLLATEQYQQELEQQQVLQVVGGNIPVGEHNNMLVKGQVELY